MRWQGLIPPLIWTAFIAVLSLMNSSNIPSNNWLDQIHADKIVHAVLYAVLFFLYFRAFKTDSILSNVIALSSIIAVATGIVIELLQWQVSTGRHFDKLDIMANITGVFICGLYARNYHLKNSRT